MKGLTLPNLPAIPSQMHPEPYGGGFYARPF